MTKNQFIKVLHNFTDTSSEEASGIVALKKSYPYSQVIHALSARLSKDHNLSNQKKALQMAAIYACDRTVLKEIMDAKAESWPASNEVVGQVHPETPESIATHQDHEDLNNNLAEELINDLHRLKELRRQFEMMFVDVDYNTFSSSSQKIITEEPTAESSEETVELEPVEDKPKVKRKPPTKKKNAGKSKAQRIVELAKKLEQEEAAEKKKEDKSLDIIDEIESSKKKIDPENFKQRQQLDIIDQFIKTQPSISAAKDKNATPISGGDLSTVKNGEFGDHIISETLVSILLNQGKKDKAIEVLKKLIWKFPQKKGYFAAQIEELKK